MKCQECNNLMKEVKVKIQDADSDVISYQCSKCGNFDFEEASIKKAITEIKVNEESNKLI
ncbi:hypothetical protein HZA97_06105 [Candidatus Woesearchaeota archaeon]|nr:hypothetical protein [Candidatus Woesearchaeota archaeon]